MATRRGVEAGRAFVLIEAIDKTGKVLSGVNKRFATLSRQFTGLGRQLTFLGGVMAVPFISAINSAKDFSDEILALKSVVVIAGNGFDSLEKKVRDLGKSTSFTAGQVAAAATALARGGFNSEEIEGSLKGVLEFARAGRTELATAATIMVRSIRSFNMEASQGSEVADKFFIAAKNGTTTVEELAQAFSFSGGTASQLGFSLGDTLAMLSKMSNKMLVGTKAGTSLNQMLLRMATRGEAVKNLTGIDIKDKLGADKNTLQLMIELAGAFRSMGDIEKVAVGEEIFNVRGLRAALALENAIEGVIDVTGQMKEGAGIAARASKLMDSGIGGSIRLIISAFDELKISVGLAFEEVFGAMRVTLIPIINAFSAWAKANQEVFVAAAKAVIVITALGAGLMALGGLFGIAAFAASGFVAAFGVISAIVAFLGGPGLIAIGAMIAVSLLFAAAWDKIKPIVVNTVKAMREAWGKFSKFFMAQWAPVQEQFQEAWKDTKPLIVGLAKVSLGMFKDMLPTMLEIGKVLTVVLLGTMQAFAKAISTVSILLKGLADWMKETFDDPLSAFRSFEDTRAKGSGTKPKTDVSGDIRKSNQAFRNANKPKHKAGREGEGGPLFGGSISRPGATTIPTPKRGPTPEQIKKRKDLIEEIRQRKQALLIENQERALAIKKQALDRAREIEDRKREILDVTKLEIKASGEADKDKRTKMLQQAKDRRQSLNRALEDDKHNEEALALRRRQDAMDRMQEVKEIVALEKTLGGTVGVRAPGIPKAGATVGSEAGGVSDRARKQLAFIQRQRTALTRGRESALQGPSATSIPDALQKGSVEAAQAAFKNKGTQKQISLLKNIDKRLEFLNRTETAILAKESVGAV